MSERRLGPVSNVAGVPTAGLLGSPQEHRAEAAAPPSVLTIAEAAKLMRIGRNLAYEAARCGEIPTVRIGRRLLVPRAALERMLERAGITRED